MNAFTLARTAILEEFETARASSPNYATDATFPIEIRNRPFDRPDSGPWGRLTLQFGERSPQGLGGGAHNMNRTPFVLILQIFVPENDGEKIANQIADEVFGPLDFATEARTESSTRLNLYFRTASLAQVGKADEGREDGTAGIEQFNATIQGHFDDTLPPQAATLIAGLTPDVFLRNELGLVSYAPGRVDSWEDQSGNGKDFFDVSLNNPVLTTSGVAFGREQYFQGSSIPFASPFILAVEVQKIGTPAADSHFVKDSSGLVSMGFDASDRAFMKDDILAGNRIQDAVDGRMNWILGKFAGSSSQFLVEGGEVQSNATFGAPSGTSTFDLGAPITFGDSRSVIVRNFVLFNQATTGTASLPTVLAALKVATK